MRTPVEELVRLRVVVRGAVQGVGFRPFVHRLATDLELRGWVRNGSEGVVCEVEGARSAASTFLERVLHERPPRAFVQGVEYAFLDPAGYGSFEIRESEVPGTSATLVLPDIATCLDCLREIFDPRDRRYRYPFTNCTNCGPRYTIVESMPYDRARTTMKGFSLCGPCRREYEDPSDRRFHAQPTACGNCGPRLELLDASGRTIASGDEALRETARALREGALAAVKGVGGFHLMADATGEQAVRELRRRKGREEKPFALLVPSLDAARRIAEVTALEAALLASPEAPILLVRRRGGGVAPSVAPDNPYLGMMLPSNPLYHLLAADVGRVLVATSGNRSEEPLAFETAEALERLKGIADVFLVHDRPIARPVDDSIVRVVADRPLVLRRARGYVPLPVAVRRPLGRVLAVGAQLKGAVAVARDREVFLSQHLGDLGSSAAFQNARRTVGDLERLLSIRPARVAHDLHPDYRSTAYAEGLSLPKVRVQHHYAHVLSGMADNDLEPPVLGVAWDGSGYGDDGTVWGGEFLAVTASGYERVAHLRTFPLPGGERAVREPRRSALGLLYEVWGRNPPEDLPFWESFTAGERTVLLDMLDRKVQCPRTSSAGRLFDAVAALLGIRTRASFEGQAAMEVEFAAEADPTEESYEPGPDWEAMVRGILTDVRQGVCRARIAAKFHNTLAETIVRVAARAGLARVVLTGGCFQNRLLTEKVIARLRAEGFRPYGHQRIPPNDGGIALGQALAAGEGACA